MTDDVRRDELARYLSGTASDAEAERVQAWLQSHPEARARLEGLGRLASEEAKGRDADSALARMRARMDEQDRPRHRRAERAREDRSAMVRMQRAWVPVLGIILLVAVAGVVLYLSFQQGTPDTRLVATGPGERQTVTLDDGTVVQLNVATRLRVPETFGTDRRVVQLEGEAFFEVATDSLRPFVVQSGEAVVQVLGTAFGVESYEAQQVAVVVAEGRVAVRGRAAPEAASAVVTPGEIARLVRDADGPPRVEVEQVRLDRFLAWREGRLVFEGTPLPEVARRLERWYDVEVVLADGVSPGRRLDATFRDEDLADVLQTIAAALQIDYRVDERRVLLMPGR